MAHVRQSRLYSGLGFQIQVLTTFQGFPSWLGSGLQRRERGRGGLAHRGTSLIRNRPPHQEYHRALGIALLQDPKGRHFLVSEVPLYLR